MHCTQKKVNDINIKCMYLYTKHGCILFMYNICTSRRAGLLNVYIMIEIYMSQRKNYKYMSWKIEKMLLNLARI